MFDYRRVRILSGKGEGPKCDEPHTDQPTLEAIRQRLTKERRGGRWAYAMVGDQYLDEDSGRLQG